MNKAIKQAWIDALRSGDYKQGKKFLHSNYEATVVVDGHVRVERQVAYCCLGVLCEVLGGEKLVAEQIFYHYFIRLNGVSYNTGSGTLGEVRDELRILDNRGNEAMTVEDELIRMNDSDGRDFNQIANWIEKHIVEEESDDEIDLPEMS